MSDEEEHPPCLMGRCPNYPCRILDYLENDKPILCKEKGFWEKYGKKEKHKT